VGDVKPGTAFHKTWQVKNTGTCRGKQSYQLVFVGGEKMNGAPSALAGESTQRHRLQAHLGGPVNAGVPRACGRWWDANGHSLWRKLKVTFNVLAGPTATPRPTQTPTTPYVKFWATTYHIDANESPGSAGEWSSSRYWVYLGGPKLAGSPHDRAMRGRKKCTPQSTHWYLRVGVSQRQSRNPALHHLRRAAAAGSTSDHALQRRSGADHPGRVRHTPVEFENPSRQIDALSNGEVIYKRTDIMHQALP